MIDLMMFSIFFQKMMHQFVYQGDLKFDSDGQYLAYSIN